ncbi:MAG: agmatine deiminase family protein [Myxococcota bacterium]|nr:agmatine deiminase family protein [Myxococcota bacterium]
MRGPAELGYRWPAEWERHAATWLTWPHNPDTWPGCLEPARREFAGFVRELGFREPVRLLVPDGDAEASARSHLAAAGADRDRVAIHRVPTDDSWIRDYGPVFLVREDGVALADFGFDCWGRKYEPWERDDAVPSVLEKLLARPRFRADFVLEGGAVDGDGAGTVLTTESCLLHPNRGAGRTREAMERRLADWLGAERTLWLGAGIEGDDTDGHVDDVVRFVAAATVVAAVCGDSSDPNHAPLADNLRRLRAMRDASGRALTVVELPMPPRLEHRGERSPASYANFLLANDCALVPVFEVEEDARALAVLREVMPGRDVVGVPSRHLVRGLGALHCLSQQEPRAPA